MEHMCDRSHRTKGQINTGDKEGRIDNKIDM